MSVKIQKVTRKGEVGHIGHDEWRWYNPDKQPSWKRYGSGSAEMTISSGKPLDGGKWLQINAQERAKEGATKAIMLCLNESAALELLAYLKEKFETRT